jgi:hypothetical protein
MAERLVSVRAVDDICIDGKSSSSAVHKLSRVSLCIGTSMHIFILPHLNPELVQRSFGKTCSIYVDRCREDIIHTYLTFSNTRGLLRRMVLQGVSTVGVYMHMVLHLAVSMAGKPFGGSFIDDTSILDGGIT